MKWLLALALLVALLAIGNRAAAGPFGVSMGDPIKPTDGWRLGGYGIEYRELEFRQTEFREYKGAFGFQQLGIPGTREGGASGVVAVKFLARKDAKISYQNLKESLSRKYGKPSAEEQNETAWSLSENPDKIRTVYLGIADVDAPPILAIPLGILGIPDPRFVAVRYSFENHQQYEKAREAGEKAEEAVRKAKEAAEKAREKRMDADI